MRLRIIGPGIVAAFILVVAATASAHEFEFSGVVPAALGGKAVTKQVLRVNAGAIVCEKTALAGVFGPPKASKTFAVKEKYTECEAFGTKVTVTEAEYLFNAEGSVGVVGEPIVVTSATGKCNVTIGTGTGNSKLQTVKYSNGAALHVKANITHVVYVSSGGLCGTEIKQESNGSYEGEVEVTGEGGTLSWK